MKLICIIILSFTLLACSTTEVHLYTRYLSDTEVEKVSSKLAKSNFKVVTNTFSFPETVQQSTLLYSPFIKDKKTLNTLIHSLSDLGWSISNVEALVKGNHWYSKNSVGLFLLPEGAKTNNEIASQDLVNEYKSRKCETTVNIHLNRNNTYEMFFLKNIDGRTDHLKGQWKVTSYPYILLTSFNKRWEFYFEIEKKIETDRVSKIEIVELKPVNNYKFFRHCSFAYGARI